MSQHPLFRIISRFKREPSRTGSLIITFYGDAILPRGGSVSALRHRLTSLQLGTPPLLPDDEIDSLLKRWGQYGLRDSSSA